MAGTDALATAYSWGIKEIDDASNSLGAAAARWCMELSDGDMAAELLLLQAHLGRLAFEANNSERDGTELSPEFRTLRRATTNVRLLALEWPDAGKARRTEIVRKLEETRIESGGDPDIMRSSPENQHQSE